MGTMLLVVGWSAVVVWLNTKPRRTNVLPDRYDYGCGFPWLYDFELVLWEDPAYGYEFRPPRFLQYPFRYPALLANIAIGLLAVLVLTFASKCLLRAIVAGLRAFMSKPPPNKGNGP